MDSAQNPSQSSTSTPNPSTSESSTRVRRAPGVQLTPDQVELLLQAFADSEIIFVKREFRSGYSGALVLLVSLGTSRAPVVVKLAHPRELLHEYEAYQKFVRQISPQNIAHIQDDPLISADGQLGLLQYSFAGGESHLPAASLRDYYESNGGEACAAVLNRIFRAFGRYWWANNRPHLYTLGEQYDRLLPVHLQVAKVELDGEPSTVLENGKTSVLALRPIEVGQTVRLVGFRVTKVAADGSKITLTALPPPNEASAPIRVRLEFDAIPERRLFSPDDEIEVLDTVVVATRQMLLRDAATAALPSFDPNAKAFTAEIGGSADKLADIALINPLYDLSGLLDYVVETKTSVIHGDLNLQNVLVDTPTGFAWIIDFGETRHGPTLLDLQRLEVQVITKLLPPVWSEAQLNLADLVELLVSLHADAPPPTPPHPALLEPYRVLVTIRRLARQYLIDDLNWDEYYLGLVVALVGALKYDELDALSRSLALVAAATANGLVGRRLMIGHAATQVPTVTPASQGQATAQISPVAVSDNQAASPRAPNRRFLGIGAGIVLALLAAILIWQLWPTSLLPTNPGIAQAPLEASTESPTEELTQAQQETAIQASTGGDAQPQAETPQAVDSTDTASESVTPSPPESSEEPATGDTVSGDTATEDAVPQDAVTDVPEEEPEEEEETLPGGEVVTVTVTSTVTSEAPGVTLAITPNLVAVPPAAATTPAIQAFVAPSSLPASSEAGDVWVNPIDEAEYVFVPEGEFTMGSDNGSEDTRPERTVFLSGFWIMRTEVTNEQYTRCVDAGDCTPPTNARWNDSTYAAHPVTEVTWQQADQYARWVGGRLPTEAEWEKAARGTDGRPYPWGEAIAENALLNFNFGIGDTVPVGNYPEGASVFGVLDMAGNVEEWVADWYAPDYYANAPAQDPTGPEEGVFRILRGGSYFSNRLGVLATSRERALPDAHFESVGFRVARSP